MVLISLAGFCFIYPQNVRFVSRGYLVTIFYCVFDQNYTARVALIVAEYECKYPGE